MRHITQVVSCILVPKRSSLPQKVIGTSPLPPQFAHSLAAIAFYDTPDFEEDERSIAIPLKNCLRHSLQGMLYGHIVVAPANFGHILVYILSFVPKYFLLIAFFSSDFFGLFSCFLFISHFDLYSPL